MNTPALLTPGEAAAFLQVSEKTLEKWRSKGTGPTFRKLGHRTVRYQQSDLSNWPGSAHPSPGRPMKNDTTATAALPAALLHQGRKRLSQVRLSIMEHIGAEFWALLPIGGAKALGPENLSAWAISACTQAGMSGDRPLCWRTLREQLAQRTADLIESTQLAEQITAGSLARFIGLDVSEFAYEGWADIERIGPALAGGGK